MTLRDAVWTLDDRAIEVVGWQAGMRANGGHDQARATARSARLPVGADQGSLLTAWRHDGSILWQGRLSAPPQVLAGLAHLTGQGHQVEARKASERLLFQTRDYGLWADASSPPFSRAAAASLRAGVQGNHLLFEVASATVTQNDAAPLQIWIRGAGLRRFAFTIDRSATSPDYDIRVQKATGPDGAATLIGDYGIDTGDATLIDVDVTSPADSLVISLVRTGATTGSATRLVVRLKDLRVNDIVSDDSMTGSAAVEALANRFGWDTSPVVTSLTNVLPLDAVDEAVASLLDRIAVLDDYRWLLLGDLGAGPQIDYGPWAREWVLDSIGADWSGLVPIELYNRVRVRYTTAAGTPSDIVVDAEPNPLAASGITNVYDHRLDGVQPDDSLANTVAALLAERLSARRYAGPIRVVACRGDYGTDPYGIRAGDVVRLADFGPAEAHVGRVYEATYTPDGVTLGIEAPADVTSLLAVFAGRAARSAVALPSMPDAGGF